MKAGDTMRTPEPIHGGQIEELVVFLEEHPRFSPQLMGENAYFCGFQMGRCFLSVEDMERLIAARVDVRPSALLQSAQPKPGKKR